MLIEFFLIFQVRIKQYLLTQFDLYGHSSGSIVIIITYTVCVESRDLT